MGLFDMFKPKEKRVKVPLVAPKISYPKYEKGTFAYDTRGFMASTRYFEMDVNKARKAKGMKTTHEENKAYNKKIWKGETKYNVAERKNHTPAENKQFDTYQEMWKPRDYTDVEEPKKRGKLDRVFDALNIGQYAVQGGIRGHLDKNMTIKQGIARGVKASNPFGDGHEKWEYKFSDNLSRMGWKPKSGGEKFVKGAVGLVGDIMLDPSTYIGGVFSGLVKGSGKTSAKIALKGQNILDVMGDSSKFIDNVGDLRKTVGMTQEMAESVIKGSKVFKSGKFTIDVAEEGAMLMNKYNKVLGINSKSSAVTLSLGNAPLGKKLFGRMADKKLTLIDSDVMKKIGDHTLAPVYARARHAVIGTQIGKMFSTNHKIYKLARDKPEDVYNFIKVNMLNVGDDISKKAMMKSVKETADLLGGLDPATQKEVMEMMEDKTIWSKIQAQVRFADTKEASGLRQKVQASKESLEGRISSVAEYDKQVRAVKKSSMMNVFEQKKALDILEAEHIDNITSINGKYIKDTEVFANVNKALDRAEAFYKKGAIDPDDLVKRFKGQSEKYTADVVDRVLENRPTKMIKPDEIIQPATMSRSSYYKTRKEMTDLGFKQYKNEKWANKFLLEFPDWDMKKTDGVFKLTPPSSKVSSGAIDNVLGIKGNTARDTFDIKDYYKPKVAPVKKNIPRPHKDLSIAETRAQTKFKSELKLKDNSYKPLTDEMLSSIQEQVRKTGFVEHKNADAIKKFASDFPDWTKSNVGDQVRFSPPGIPQKVSYKGTPFKRLTREAKGEYIEDLSKYIFGSPEAINKGTHPNQIEEVVKMIENGSKVEDIAYHIFDNRMDFNGANKAKYNFIADTLGYENWADKFRIPMDKEIAKELKYKQAIDKAEALRKVGRIDEANKVPIPNKPSEAFALNLRQTDLKREVLKSQFDGAKTLDEVERIIGTFNEEKFNRNVDEIMASVRRDNKVNPVGASTDSWDIKSYIDDLRNTTNKLSEGKSTVKYGRTLDSEVEEELFETFSNLNKSRPVKNFKEKHAYDRFVREVEKQSAGYPLDIRDLHKNTRDGIYNRAYNSVSKGWDINNKPNTAEYAQQVIRDMQSDKAKRAIEAHKLTQASVGRNNKITFSIKGDRMTGVVDAVSYQDGKKLLTVNVDGTFHKVKQNEVLARLGNAPPKTLDDIRDTSQLYNRFVNKQSELQEQVNRALTGTSMPKFKNDGIAREYHDGMTKANYQFARNQRSIEINLIGLEKELAEARFKADFGHAKFLNNNAKEIMEVDKALNNADAFESYVKNFFGVTEDTIDSVNSHYTPNIGEWILKPHKDYSDESKEVVEMLTGLFEKMGKSEVELGSLKNIQFEKMDRRYLPHVLTKEGKEIINNRDVGKVIKDGTEQFGLGKAYNQFAESRTIKRLKVGGEWIENPNVSQINEYFNEMFPELTKGNKIMSENIADIYLARAMKNADLVYDGKYIDNILNVFGEEYTGKIADGYNTVTNYGSLKEFTRKNYSLNTQLDMSEAVSAHLKENDTIRILNERALNMVRDGKSNGKTQPQLASDMISKYIKEFKEQTFPDDVRKSMNNKYLESFFKQTGTAGILDNAGAPLGQLNHQQIKAMEEAHSSTAQRYLRSIQERFGKLSNAGGGKESKVFDMGIEQIQEGLTDMLKHSDGDRIGRVQGLIDKVDDYLSFKPAEVRNVSQAITEKANRTRQLQIVKDNNALLGMYDKFTHFIKLNQTAVSPAFHARNKLSNMFNNWLEVGGDAVNPSFQKQTMAGLRGKLDGEFLEILGKNGKKTKIDWAEVVRQAEANNAIDSGVFGTEVAGTVNKAKGLLSKLIGDTPLSKIDPTDTEKFIGYTYGTKAGSMIENHDRFTHFVSKLKNGASFAEAGESVNKFLFDYSDLTMFEQSTMKRLLPYYTWLRKNSALQLEMLIEKPEKFRNIGKVMGSVESMVEEEDRIDKKWLNDFAKDWVQTPFHVTNPEGNREPVLWNPNLPFQDLAEIPNPFDIQGTATDYFTKLNPIIKIPIELGMNKNVFFDNDIVKEDSENPGRDRAKHVANQFALVPIAEGFMNKSGADLGLHTLNNTSGIKMISYDYDKWKSVKQYQLSKKKEQIKNKGGSPYSKAVKRKLFSK